MRRKAQEYFWGKSVNLAVFSGRNQYLATPVDIVTRENLKPYVRPGTIAQAIHAF